jgi:hypothetical protein
MIKKIRKSNKKLSLSGFSVAKLTKVDQAKTEFIGWVLSGWPGETDL